MNSEKERPGTLPGLLAAMVAAAVVVVIGAASAWLVLMLRTLYGPR